MRPWLPIVLLASAFTLATRFEPWFQTWAGHEERSGSVLGALLGDSRRMFANHAFVKADVYFHAGYYPTVFDNRESYGTAHIAADSGAAEDRNTGEEGMFLAPPADWIDSFGRKFYPSEHVHIDASLPAGGAGHEAAHEAEETEKLREMLPWLKMSTELDPHRVDSYVVAAFWLRERMHRIDEAEQFLRDGLRENPDSYEIYYEVGRLAFESRNDHVRARRMWTIAIEKWKKTQAGLQEPDLFMLRNILSMLAHLEEEDGHLELALKLLKDAKAADGGGPVFDLRIQKLTEKMGAAPTAP